ncbi:hypothetical protein PoB_001657500 [Plakobranchus ocellatus]|uniref:Uncharacterized protein n=1 Tax=Plakobranchus ocellatus TaxID=259542 RepID=A0AAV3Z695_9GAST|nr:hypothetical protein PoB_001657500 [Plakobranchus ocellatus]
MISAFPSPFETKVASSSSSALGLMMRQHETRPERNSEPCPRLIKHLVCIHEETSSRSMNACLISNAPRPLIVPRGLRGRRQTNHYFLFGFWFCVTMRSQIALSNSPSGRTADSKGASRYQDNITYNWITECI